MICYRDRTYCPHYTNCVKGNTCDKAFTLDIEAAAIAAGLPVSYYLDRPECFENNEGDKK